MKRSPSASRVVSKLKPDLEAFGEQELARLEIAALLSRPDDSIPPVIDGSIDLGDLSLSEVEFLASRLAFTDHLEKGGKTFPCAQARIERSYVKLASLNGNGEGVSGASRRRNDYLTHGFHKYKAKFFPRLARSLINIVCGRDGTRVLDPFVGSGTALVEAYTMGINGSGVDIDPLSVFICRQKVGALISGLHNPGLAERLMCVATRTPLPSGQSSLFARSGKSERYRLPEYIRSKVSADIAEEIEHDVTTLRAYSDGIDDAEVSALAALALSHAIATKISLRWMGTGDNRFSLSVNSRSILTIFKKQITAMSNALATANKALLPTTATMEVIEGSALALPFENATFDGIVTSPPYVPASSGRETYLRSRGPSLIALDLVTEKEIPERESRMVGSVLNRDGLGVKLPAEVVELVEWMRPQRARAPKAEATGAYFAQLDLSLREMARVLRPGGRAAMVLAAAHTLYDLVSRETVRVMDMPVLVEKLLACGEPIPLRLIRSIRMDLAKMDFAARPASKGAYSEAILFFEHR